VSLLDAAPPPPPPPLAHRYGYKPEVTLDPAQFQHVFTSKYHKIRIYKVVGVDEESKQWVEKNRVCDAPGSWCVNERAC
jgi:dolichyl-diphosphooligosaccharide--protein glycosyltransferase